MPNNQTMNPKQTTIVLLRILNFSSIQAVKGSKSEIEELKAAIEIKVKKIMENKLPKGNE